MIDDDVDNNTHLSDHMPRVEMNKNETIENHAYVCVCGRDRGMKYTPMQCCVVICFFFAPNRESH